MMNEKSVTVMFQDIVGVDNETESATKVKLKGDLDGRDIHQAIYSIIDDYVKHSEATFEYVLDNLKTIHNTFMEQEVKYMKDKDVKESAKDIKDTPNKVEVLKLDGDEVLKQALSRTLKILGNNSDDLKIKREAKAQVKNILVEKIVDAGITKDAAQSMADTMKQQFFDRIDNMNDVESINLVNDIDRDEIMKKANKEMDSLLDRGVHKDIAYQKGTEIIKKSLIDILCSKGMSRQYAGSIVEDISNDILNSNGKEKINLKDVFVKSGGYEN